MEKYNFLAHGKLLNFIKYIIDKVINLIFNFICNKLILFYSKYYFLCALDKSKLIHLPN